MKKYIPLFLIIGTSLTTLWGQVTDSYLKQYMQIGVQNNLELQAARHKLEASHAKRFEAFSGFLPSVDLSSRYTRNDKEVSISIPPVNIPMQAKVSTDTKAEVTQVLFNPAVYYNYKMQRQSTKGDEFDYQTKLRSTEFNILEAYYNCAKAKELIAVKKASLDLAKENHHVASNLYAVDKVPKSDLLRAEVGLMTGEQEIRDAQNQYNLARNYFNSLLNRDLTAEVNCASLSSDSLLNLQLDSVLPAPDSVDTALQTAIKLRSELKQAEAGLGALRSAYKINLSQYVPSLVMVGSYGYNGDDLNYTSSEDYWNVSGVLSWNIFSGFKSTAQAKQMKEQVREMEKNQENVKSMIELDVRNSYTSYQFDRDQFAVAKETYQTALENYRMVELQYKNELAPQLNLLDAKSLLDSSRTNLIVSYFNIMVSQAKYTKSLGYSLMK